MQLGSLSRRASTCPSGKALERHALLALVGPLLRIPYPLKSHLLLRWELRWELVSLSSRGPTSAPSSEG